MSPMGRGIAEEALVLLRRRLRPRFFWQKDILGAYICGRLDVSFHDCILRSLHTGQTSCRHWSLIRLQRFLLCLRHSTSPPPPGHQVQSVSSLFVLLFRFSFLISLSTCIITLNSINGEIPSTILSIKNLNVVDFSNKFLIICLILFCFLPDLIDYALFKM